MKRRKAISEGRRPRSPRAKKMRSREAKQSGKLEDEHDLKKDVEQTTRVP